MRSARERAATLVLGLAGLSCASDGARHDVEAPPDAPLFRPDTPGNARMFAFDPGEVVETFDSADGRFRMHFTRAGSDKVPAADVDMSGVPDFVELVAATFQDVYTHYQTMGFLAPVSDASLGDNGGDGRFDVYLVDFAGQGDGHFQTEGCVAGKCTGYMILENDFLGYGYSSLKVATEIVASHEYFHAIQAAYDAFQGPIIAEGTAVWGTETFDPALKDFEGFLPGYLDNTDRPLDQPIGGATDPFSYGTTLFFWFLEEKYGDGMIRGLWERCADGANGVADPQWFALLDGYLQENAQVSFADAFIEFSRWNLFTKSHADPTQAYAAGAGYADVKMTDEIAPYAEDALRLYHSSAQYYRVAAAGRTSMSAAYVPKTDGDTDGLALILAVEASGKYTSAIAVTDLTAIPELDVSGATNFVVVAISTVQDGDSKKPGLCIGSADEIATCTATIQAAGTGGAGGATGGGGRDGSEDGCSCTVAGEPGRGVGSWVALGFAALASRRLHRRR